MDKIVTGILAHVDAGKTTLSECMLYGSGSIRKMGRVDNKDAYLDTNHLEKERGITIFSKQAVFQLETKEVMLLDTPGHVDFSAEMERTLQVLDYAILVISGADGVQGHTQTLWSLLRKYRIPVFLFVNKMDQPGTQRETLLQELKERLGEGCVDFTEQESEDFQENVAVCHEELLEEYLESGDLIQNHIVQAIKKRWVYPVFFGSALKNDGVDQLMEGLEQYTAVPAHSSEFGAKVFKIARDDQGNRLTYVKITGGTLKVKSMLDEEKVNQIRIYSGAKFEAVQEVEAGSICALTGLANTYPGQGFGIEEKGMAPILSPILTYQIILPEGCDASSMLPKLRQIEEEDPQLHIVWDENLKEIQAQLMGEVQIEIIKSLVKERFQVDVAFGPGNIVYKETILDRVEGVGHFEPLRHYAEVHLLLEPLERGSGLVFESQCSEDILDKNWQRLILTHLAEKEHLGVLTGSAITDVKIILAAGRAHQKHTEGGDFRQATYRAVRQGLMQSESVLLEPYYHFRLELPQQMVGRAMTDLEKRNGIFETPETVGELAILQGRAPVSTITDYPKEVIAYSKGHGRMFLEMDGYDICHDQEEIVSKKNYEPEHDLINSPDSVFCAHGAGFVVPWYEVADYMHLESVLREQPKAKQMQEIVQNVYRQEEWIDSEEVDRILNQATQANRRDKEIPRKGIRKKKKEDYFEPPVVRRVQRPVSEKEYLLVDGYNIIFAWKELNELAAVNIDGARGRLLDIMCNYQGIRRCNLIVVFDAYRVKGHMTEIMDYHNIHVVYTKEAETADQYIEKFAHENGKKYQVTVATSDGLEQVIIRGQGCGLLSARELEEEIHRVEGQLREDYLEQQPKDKVGLLDGKKEELSQQLLE